MVQVPKLCHTVATRLVYSCYQLQVYSELTEKSNQPGDCMQRLFCLSTGPSSCILMTAAFLMALPHITGYPITGVAGLGRHVGQASADRLPACLESSSSSLMYINVGRGADALAAAAAPAGAELPGPASSADVTVAEKDGSLVEGIGLRAVSQWTASVP